MRSRLRVRLRQPALRRREQPRARLVPQEPPGRLALASLAVWKAERALRGWPVSLAWQASPDWCAAMPD